MSTVPKLVSNWFSPEKRGFAMALITPGGTLCSITLGIVAPILIAMGNWQFAFMCVGAFCAVLVLFIIIFIKESPAEKGLRPYGVPEGAQIAPEPTIEEERGKGAYMKVLKMPITWHFGITHAFYQFGFMAATAYYVVSMTSIGFSGAEAGLSITFGGLFTICMLQVWGNLSDRIERKWVLLIGNIMAVICSAAYCFILQGSPTVVICWIMIALITAAVGTTPVWLAAIGDYYPEEIRGTGSGIISTIGIVGRYGGPWIAGMIIDAAGGVVAYGFLTIAICCGISAILCATLPNVRKNASAK